MVAPIDAGVVDLRDLSSRHRWLPRNIARFLELTGLVADGKTRQSFAPPRALVVIAAADEPWSVERARAWLTDAERLVLIRDGAVNHVGWRDALAGLDCEVFDGLTRETCAAALASARRPLPDRVEPPEPEQTSPIELPPTPWSEYAIEPRYGPPIVDRLERRELRIDDHSRIALTELPSFVRLESDAHTLSAEEARDAWKLRPGFKSLGFDPIQPTGWRGSRMAAFWMYGTPGRSCFLSATDHDFPCGPAKKLYGYDDNDPVQVVVAPDASIFAAQFEHDVLLTAAVPIPWRHAGSVWVAVFDPDPRRAVFFAQDVAEDEGRMTSDLLDEDARDLAPALVLGPSATCRYAVDLTHRVVRIDAPEAVTIVGGPNGGFAVFDADHRLVRTATGRLLGGWFRWATIEDDDAYWREDLATGERTRIAPVDFALADAAETRSIARDAMLEGRPDVARAIQASGPHTAVPRPERCVAIPGTRNVLLVGARHFRVV